MKYLSKEISLKMLRLALPVMLTQAGQVSVQLVDNILVGRLIGDTALASMSLANGILYSIYVIGLGFSLAMPPLISEADTQRDGGRIQRILRTGFWINLFWGIALMCLTFLCIPLLPYLGQPADVVPNTGRVLVVLGISLIPTMLFQTLREFSEGLGNTLSVTQVTIAGNIINIVLNYILIQGLYGFPALGIMGSAWATLIARTLILFIMLPLLFYHKKVGRYIRDFSLSFKNLGRDLFIKMLRLGYPTSLQLFFEVTAFAGAAFICGLVSAEDIAAHQIALSIASITFNFCIGLGVASTIMIGNKLGEKDFVGLRQTGINNLMMVFIFMSICGLFFILFREDLPIFFSKENNPAVIEVASALLITGALFQLSDGIQVMCIASLRGMQDVKIPSIITFVAYWMVSIPLGYFLTVTMGLGAAGMWYALGIGLTISAVLLVFRFHYKSLRFLK